jgi:hypothetical protein
MTKILLMACLVGVPANALAQKMTTFNFEDDTVEGMVLKGTRTFVEDAAFSGQAPDKALADINARVPSADGRKEAAFALMKAYEFVGDAAGVHALHAKFGSHLELAHDAFAALDWKTLDSELELARKGASTDADRQAVHKAAKEYATTLHNDFKKTRNHSLGEAAAQLYAHEIATADAAEKAQLQKDVDDLDEAMKPTTGVVMMGTLDKEIVRRHIRTHTTEIQGCFNRALMADPKTEGKVTLTILIGTDGRATAKLLDDTTKADAFVKCLVANANTWRFPGVSNGGQVSVVWPMVFHASNP